MDDDRLVLVITADLIRSMGHDVIEAPCACDAAMAIEAGSAIALLITDIGMPNGPGGFKLADYARRKQPGLREIYFSGIPDLASEGGAATLLRKLCTLRELRQAIASV